MHRWIEALRLGDRLIGRSIKWRRTHARIVLQSSASSPFLVVGGAFAERLLRANARGRKSSVKIRASNRFSLRQAFGEEHGKAADKSIARSRAVNALHGERRDMLATFGAGEKRSVCSQRDNHAPNTFRQELLGTFFGVIYRLDAQSADRFRFMLVGDKVVETIERCHVDRLGRCRIHNASNSMLSCKGNRVVNGLERDFKLENDAIGGLQSLGSGVYVGRLQCIVSTLHNENAILAAGLDKNRGNAAR